MILASLELVRLQLPTDPWQQDAARARQQAVRKGQNPSFWFGPTGYRAVEYKEWKRRMDQALNKAQNVGKSVNLAKEVYSEIRENNRQLSHKILEELKRENEQDAQTRENKALIELKEEEGHDIASSSSASTSNSNINSSTSDSRNLNTNNNNNSNGKSATGEKSRTDSLSVDSLMSAIESLSTTKSDEWDALEPWEKLRLETDIAVRIMPHTRGVQEQAADKSLSINLSLDDDSPST
ncbi:hypothetical protein AWJ20_3777 [Sugiyamaella lignohabitans]|uniref:Uncharacterized protein n=1 Tax=Sugiyamaella lignohabitans TaxID=796027 RepID=A0A167BYH7_9ASCO|nr:uncharacterized protein AWJ20_3777 [Sugiyamaella lignohabitans]ANB10983.1 hypothetical protein AWJ20_3777 [Sugiyamaella lignohabitans]